jgi:hypothetical protein
MPRYPKIGTMLADGGAKIANKKDRPISRAIAVLPPN